MPSVAATSHADRLPVTDGRSAEAQYLRRIRDELRQHVGGAPTIAQKLLIDRVAHVALRLHALDCEPMLPENSEYLEMTRLLGELLAQIGAQMGSSATKQNVTEIMRSPGQLSGAAA